MTDAELRRLAEAATAGPYRGCNNVRGECDCDYEGDVWSTSADVIVLRLGPCQCHDDNNCDGGAMTTKEQGLANGRFFAALDPATVIGLLDRLADLEP